MNTRFFTLLSCLLVLLASCKKHPRVPLSQIAIIPQPAVVVPADGIFELTNTSGIYTSDDAALTAIGEYAAAQFRPATGFDLKVSNGADAPEGSIVLTLVSDSELGDEGYKITTDEARLTIAASKPAGVFLALQTVRQLLPPAIESKEKQNVAWEIPTGSIRDYPTYKWRGAMLDVARHFFGVDDVKRYIDLISHYKINTLHLHLSDDQGWRIEIKSRPDLTTIGGSTQVGGGKGGFYTQEQYKDLVAYAQSRFITIVPEIDLPGHINSALASYGELNGGTVVPAEGRVEVVRKTEPDVLGKKSKSKPTELYSGIKVGWSTLRVEKPQTFEFVEDVLKELTALTPGPYLHIGGDEAAATKKEDYIVFINRFKDMVKAHGKTMVGWEEIAQGDINGNIVTQYWHSSKYALMAADKGSKIIMSPAKKAYLDMKYDSTTKLGLHWAGYIDVDTAYLWDPATVAIGLPVENILGVEAPLWSETVTNIDEIEYLLFPRLPGYAEIGWSKSAGRSWDEYKQRLGKHAGRFKYLGIDYYKSPKVPWVD